MSLPNTGITYTRRPRWRAYRWRRYSGQCGGCGGSGRCSNCDGTGGHEPPEWGVAAGFYDLTRPGWTMTEGDRARQA